MAFGSGWWCALSGSEVSFAFNRFGFSGATVVRPGRHGHPPRVASLPDSKRTARLVERARAGDREAFDELYLAHRDWVHGLAWRFTGVEEDALDVLQETFLYLVRKLPTLALHAKLTTFLYPVVKHLAADARRKRGRYEEDEAALELARDEGGGSSDLAELVCGLPEAQRETVLLRFADGLSVEETAAALGVPEGTVKSRLHHALRALREDPRLAKEFGEES